MFLTESHILTNAKQEAKPPENFDRRPAQMRVNVASNARACLSGLFCLSVEACWACFPTDSTLIEPPY